MSSNPVNRTKKKEREIPSLFSWYVTSRRRVPHPKIQNNSHIIEKASPKIGEAFCILKTDRALSDRRSSASCYRTDLPWKTNTC